MATSAVEHEQAEQPRCWCCGNLFVDSELTRLGNHPEVGVCAGCARWLHRRAGSGVDARLRQAPGAWVRRAVGVVRGRVIRSGAPDSPLLGPLLRRLDRHLP